MDRVVLSKQPHRLESVTMDPCRHIQVREIGEDFDKDGRLLRLIRCERCGLLMREYLLSF